MSELKALVDALRGMSNDELRQVCTTRLVQLSNLADFYALAEALNTSKSYSAIVGSLSRIQLDSLAKISRGETVADTAFESLHSLLLAYRVGEKQFTFENLLDQLKQHRAFTRSLMVVPELDEQPEQETIDRNAGLAAFETMQAITELIFDVERHLVREVGKGGVGLPDVKRLAQALGRPNDYAKRTFALAERLGLTAVLGGRHLLTGLAMRWIAWSPLERLGAFVEYFKHLTGASQVEELAKLPAGTSLRFWLVSNFPLAETTDSSRIGQILKNADAFGLAFDAHTTSWFVDGILGTKGFSSKIEAHLPKVQERIILQGDLSIIAPGPLPTSLEQKLRKFAETESVSLASTYRLSPLSVCHGLELGLSISDIETTLADASGKPLPQPVAYLLKEVATRFGRLTLVEGSTFEARTLIRSEDNILLAEIGNDQRLRPFGFTRPSASAIASRFEPSVVYFGLRECGYLAIRKDSEGRVISPIETTEPTAVLDASGQNSDAIERLRSADAASLDSGDDETLVRQIQLAIRNKAKLSITVALADGNRVTVELVPSSVANGRMRGRDIKAQVERTLPLTTIVTLTLA